MVDANIMFLGTGGDSFVVGKQSRATAGTILHVDGCQFHMDPGPGALVHSINKGINPRQNTAVLVSNSRMHNSYDAEAIISAMTYDGIDKKGVLITSPNLVDQIDDIQPIIRKHYTNSVERIIRINPGQKIGVENIEIHALKTLDQMTGSIGYRFVTPWFSIAFSGDTKFDESIIEQYKGSDILVLNVKEPLDSQKGDYLTCDDVIDILAIVNPSLCIIKNFGNKMLSSNPLYQARMLSQKTGVQVIAASDGFSMNPISYKSYK